MRISENEFYVLEDNLRTPSGVSYMLQNRRAMMRLFPELFACHRIALVEHYPHMRLNALRQVAPDGVDNPTGVVITPGAHNSANFEHAFLAQQIGVEIVEGQDLFVRTMPCGCIPRKVPGACTSSIVALRTSFQIRLHSGPIHYWAWPAYFLPTGRVA